ncbi:uncharacterized protein At1g76070-like [Arachis stenosperma]|uniref:uncharacterized protein At1g76070-like n=1 Tax=Arachis stenosperma TaxID=217475 RepID=UPI0025AD6A47|nr:uncharacterized protein At1g76070-like [Arachis stenosperma]
MMMEKISKLKNKLFKFFLTQPVVASMALQNPTMSPNNSVSKRGCRSHHGFKVSIVPKEVRRKHRSASFRSNNEPSSPKVSCMGDVKCKKKRMALKQKRVEETIITKRNDDVPCEQKKGKVLLWIFKGQKQSGGNKGFVLEEKAQENSQVIAAPSLGAMKKFKGGRGSLRDFDVTITKRC